MFEYRLYMLICSIYLVFGVKDNSAFIAKNSTSHMRVQQITLQKIYIFVPQKLTV